MKKFTETESHILLGKVPKIMLYLQQSNFGLLVSFIGGLLSIFGIQYTSMFWRILIPSILLLVPTIWLIGFILRFVVLCLKCRHMSINERIKFAFNPLTII